MENKNEYTRGIMRITVLGSGTSGGVPEVTCKCDTCLSTDPKDKRMRASIFIEVKGKNILIDCGPDFRSQVLQNNIDKIDYILLTHEHFDHTFGLGDLRPFGDVHIYAENNVCASVRRTFPYCFAEVKYPGIPKLTLHEITEKPFLLDDIEIIPIRYMHAALPILGYRIGNFAYITDISSIQDEELEKLKGLEILIVDALRKTPHFSHFSLEQAQEFAAKIHPKTTYFTHICHSLGRHVEVSKELPFDQHLTYDGMKLEVIS